MSAIEYLELSNIPTFDFAHSLTLRGKLGLGGNLPRYWGFRIAVSAGQTLGAAWHIGHKDLGNGPARVPNRIVVIVAKDETTAASAPIVPPTPIEQDGVGSGQFSIEVPDGPTQFVYVFLMERQAPELVINDAMWGRYESANSAYFTYRENNHHLTTAHLRLTMLGSAFVEVNQLSSNNA